MLLTDNIKQFINDHQNLNSKDVALKLSKHPDLPKDVIVKGIRDVASHMNALSYVYLVSADLAETALDD